MIEAAGSGLSVTWTTVVCSVGGKAKHKTQTLSFSATGAGSQYWSDALTDPFGHGVAWAGIEDQTLSVFVLNIDRKVDGEDLRVVKAKLARNK